MCLAQGHNEVPPVRLEPVALRSRTKHSKYHYVTALPIELQWGFIGLLTCSVFDYRTHQDNVGYLFNTASEFIGRERVLSQLVISHRKLNGEYIYPS